MLARDAPSFHESGSKNDTRLEHPKIPSGLEMAEGNPENVCFKTYTLSIDVFGPCLAFAEEEKNLKEDMAASQGMRT